MCKKHSYEYVKKYFEDNCCELLEENYISSQVKMKFRCSCGNIHFIKFSHFKDGHRCVKCGGTEKHTFDSVKQYFEDNGCELLETEYINNMTKMNYKCSCGNLSKIIFSKFQQGQRCSKCGGTKKLTYEYVKQYFEEQNCKLLETEYINAHTKMKYICICGNESEISFSSFKRGHRCKKCGHKKKVKNNEGKTRKHTLEYIKKYFEKNGCELLETEYINNSIPMKYRCCCENISKISFNSFKKGHRCMKCGNKKNSKSKTLSYDYVKQRFIDNGCELLENEYISAKTSMKYKCTCGNISKISFDSFNRGARCKKCAIKNNSGENNRRWNPNREEIKKNKFYKKRYLSLLYKYLKRINKNKENHTHEILGYSSKDLQTYIINHPNYEKVKDGKWHIDHIIPINAFIEHKIYDEKLINSLDNLQPLSAFDNMSKSDNYLEEDFINYCRKHEVKIIEIYDPKI